MSHLTKKCVGMIIASINARKEIDMGMDNLFGIAEKALKVTEDRAMLITNNLVNSSTPQYKAKDIDFNKVMQSMSGHGQLQTSSSRHITNTGGVGAENIMYRIPMQTSIDGNTVDPEIERKNFLQNSIHYQISLNFIQGKADSLMKAIKGE